MNLYIMTSYMIDISNWLKSDGASFCEENNIDINAFKLASQLDILAKKLRYKDFEEGD